MGCCSSAHTPKSRNPPFSKRPFGRSNRRVLRRFACPAVTALLVRTTFLKYLVPNPYSPPKALTSGVRFGVKIHAERTPPVRRHGTALLPESCRVTACAFPGVERRDSVSRLDTPIVANPYCPSALSSWLRARHHPLAHQRNAHCLASTSSDLPAGSYSGHSPRLRGFKHLTDQVRHRGPARRPQSFPR